MQVPQDHIFDLGFLFGTLGPSGHGRRGFPDLCFEFFGFGWIFNRGYRKSRRTSEKSLSLVSRVHGSWTTHGSPRVRGSGTFSSGQTPRVAQRAGRFGNVSERQHARCPLTCIMSSTVFWTESPFVQTATEEKDNSLQQSKCLRRTVVYDANKIVVRKSSVGPILLATRKTTQSWGWGRLCVPLRPRI